jgi:hypothetical protein
LGRVCRSRSHAGALAGDGTVEGSASLAAADPAGGAAQAAAVASRPAMAAATHHAGETGSSCWAMGRSSQVRSGQHTQLRWTGAQPAARHLARITPVPRLFITAMSDPSPLYQQILQGVHQLDAQAGRQTDDKSANMAASLYALAMERGFARVDHVLIGGQGSAAQRGEYVFIVQGDPRDPAHLRASLKTVDAVSTPQADSLASAQAHGAVNPAASLSSPAPSVTPATPVLG